MGGSSIYCTRDCGRIAKETFAGAKAFMTSGRCKIVFNCEGLLGELYHDWPVCLRCGYPATTERHVRPFKYRRTVQRIKSYECRVCGKHNVFHPGLNHETTGRFHCYLPVQLGELEREYIDWACLEGNPSGVHLVTWPDIHVRFTPILSYALFKSNNERFKRGELVRPRIIVHISPKSPSIDRDVIREYELGGTARYGIESSLTLSPSTALGYLHICEHYEANLTSCPIDNRYSMTETTRGGILQSAINLLSFVTDYENWPADRIFYIVTNERFSLTGFSLDTMRSRISEQIKDFDLAIIVDNLCSYLQEARIGGFASFLQMCIDERIPVIAFAPRSAIRFQIGELIPTLRHEKDDLSIHTLDTKERIAYLLEKDRFLRISTETPLSPYSTYAEVADKWS